MNRYEIARDYRKKFIDENKSVWSNSIKSVYISINGDNAKASTNPYSMEHAEHELVIFSYLYTVVTQENSSLVPLFFNANGEIEDFIIIDGWKLYFSSPVTSMYRCYNTYVYMVKDGMEIRVDISPWDVAEEFPRIWNLFYIVKNCNSQIEIDYAKKIFKQTIEIDNLKTKNLKAEAKIDSLNMLIASYKELLDKISSLIKT